MVDGFHRVAAYGLAKRTKIPARSIEVSIEEAGLLSKFANTEGATMRMHTEQYREQCWQLIGGGHGEREDTV